MSTPSNARYKKAGVDIDAGTQFVERIKPHAKATMRPGVIGGIGGFGAVFDLKLAGFEDALLVSTTDGVGTKLKLAAELNVHTTIGIDLVAMCVNDLVVQGATPLFFLDYYASGKLEVGIASDVVTGISKGCQMAGCALVGGETAEMPGMYAMGEYDLAGFAVGAVSRANLLPKTTMTEGDVLLGLSSSGVHSNGYSLVRHIIHEKSINLGAPPHYSCSHASLGASLLTPTKIYVKSLLPSLDAGHIKALAHITGGGLTDNLPRVLPATLSARIDLSAWHLPPVFGWLHHLGSIPMEEMLRTFNCGIGMVIVVAKEMALQVRSDLEKAGEQVVILGELIAAAEKRVKYEGTLE